MRQIKFRGRDIENGEWIYGNLTYYEAEMPGDTDTFAIDTGYETRYVEPDSVAQLVDHAANGYELYEGDTEIIDGVRYEYKLRSVRERCES